jgi:Bacterial PH domain
MFSSMKSNKEQTSTSSMFKILSNNFKQIDATVEEKACRSKYPELLHKDETIFMAFKSIGEMGRDKKYFTNRRILIKDGKGIGTARRNYLSIPYEKITYYSICTAGKFLDCDVEFRCTTKGNITVGIDFASDKVSIFTIQQFMNEKVLNQNNNNTENKTFQDEQGHATVGTTGSGAGGGVEKLLNWLGDNAVQLNATNIQSVFTKDYPVNEHVQFAFKSGRDTTLITNKRFMIIDVKGWSGKKINFCTIPWSSISAYSVETAGNWDRGMCYFQLSFFLTNSSHVFF